MSETLAQFEKRKQDHIRIALDLRSQAQGLSGLDQIELIHEALPELDFSSIDVTQKNFGEVLRSCFFISSMTAGHFGAADINLTLARAAAENGWMMGVGSQRRELSDSEAGREWKDLRRQIKKPLVLCANLGLSQVIQTPVAKIQGLLDSVQASALFVHTNPLQECLQSEGTPQFFGGLRALENLCKTLEIPVVLKEVGCGFSSQTLSRLKGLGLFAVDVSGLGGTHWGRIEGQRVEEHTGSNQDARYVASQTFANWGISTVQSLLNAQDIAPDYQLWASGGVRSGLDAAKLLALGAVQVGVAKPLLEAALEGEAAVIALMRRFEFELRIAMFCTGCDTVKALAEKKVWVWNTKK